MSVGEWRGVKSVSGVGVGGMRDEAMRDAWAMGVQRATCARCMGGRCPITMASLFDSSEFCCCLVVFRCSVICTILVDLCGMSVSTVPRARAPRKIK
jgi:hypothetical protein